MALDYLKIQFGLVLDRDLADPFLLFSCRARFDAAFRLALGCLRGDCSGCRSTASCPYTANLAQTISDDPEAVKRHQKPPLPFVFRFPVLPASPNRGARLQCALALFGRAGQQLPHYLVALRQVMSEIGITVTEARACCPGGGGTPISLKPASCLETALPILSPWNPDSCSPLSPTRITLQFLTPVKLFQEGRVLKRVAFAPLLRSLMRRASAMACYYGASELALDYRWLSAKCEEISTDESDCRFVEWGGRISGILGSASFTGELEEFHLLLLLGEVLQVGKGASFGLGALRILP